MGRASALLDGRIPSLAEVGAGAAVGGALGAIGGAQLGKFASAQLGLLGGELTVADTTTPSLTLYRGVASDSPGFANALKGIANPIGGDATMVEHSLGNTASNFTSWTSDYDTALKFATNGGTITAQFSPIPLHRASLSQWHQTSRN